MGGSGAQLLELTSRVAKGGDGIGRLPDGRVVFVEGALPGETVRAEITELRRDFARARLVEVVSPSPGRVTAPCPHRRRGCGGCPWQEAAPSLQIGLKEQIVADALVRIGRIPAPVLAPTVHLPVTGYRTTVHLAVDAGGRPAYHLRHDGARLAVDSCLIAHPWITEILASLLLPGHDAATIRVGVAGGERLVVLPGRARSRPGPAPARRSRPGPVAGSAVAGSAVAGGSLAGGSLGTGQVVVAEGVQVVGPATAAFVHEDVGGRRWRVGARAFFQPGPAAAEALVAAVDAAVGDAVGAGGVVVDAYAGIGLLGGVVAGRRRARLVAVEADPVAAADARHNLAGLDATIVAGEVGRWGGVAADVVIADPARSGLGRPGVGALTACGAARLVLVSCDPASLGRDAALLAAAGYRLVRTQIVDSFAQTVHIEAVSVFDRSGRGDPVRVPGPLR